MLLLEIKKASLSLAYLRFFCFVVWSEAISFQLLFIQIQDGLLNWGDGSSISSKKLESTAKIVFAYLSVFLCQWSLDYNIWVLLNDHSSGQHSNGNEGFSHLSLARGCNQLFWMQV